MIDFDDRDYSKAFIALHPFLLIDGFDPAEVGYGPYSVNKVGKVTGQAPTEVLLEGRIQPPDEKRIRLFAALERAMKNAAKSISWREVQSSCRLSELACIQRALYSIENGSAAVEDAVSLEKILRFCDAEHAFLPTSGHIQPVMEKKIGELLKSVGTTELIASRLASRFSAHIPVEFLQTDEPIGSAPILRSAPDLRDVSDVQMLRGSANNVAVVCDDGEFYSTIFSADRIAVEGSQYFEGFEWDLNARGLWWLRN
jgi:hypothetical protein